MSLSPCLFAAAIALGLTAPAAEGQDRLLPAPSAGQRAILAAQADSIHAEALALLDEPAGRAREAVALLRDEIARQSRLGRTREEGAAWNVLGHALMGLQQPDSALAAYRQAVTVRRLAGDAAGVAGSTNNIGNAFRDLAMLDSAIMSYHRAIALHRANDDLHTEAVTLRNLALVQMDSAPRDMSQRDSAIASLQRAVTLHRALGAEAGHEEFVNALEELSYIHDEDAGALDAAAAALHEALDIAVRHTDRARESDLLYNIANLHARSNRPDSAIAYFTRSADVAGRQGNTASRVDALVRIGDLHQLLGASAPALAAFGTALELAEGLSDSLRMARVLVETGSELMAAGRLDSAAALIRRSRSIAVASGALAEQSHAASVYAAYFVRTGQFDSSLVQMRQELSLDEQLGDTSAQIGTLLRMVDTFGNRTEDNAAMLADSARRALARAVDLSNELSNEHGHRKVRGDVRLAQAVAMLNRRAYDSTRRYAREAAGLYASVGNLTGQARALRFIAVTHADPDSITMYAEHAIALADSAGSPTLARQIHAAIGDRYLLLAQPDSTRPMYPELALHHLERSLELSRATADPLHEAEALLSIGVVYKWWRPARYADAAAYFDSTWHVQEAMRRNAGDDATRIAFSEDNGNTSRRLADAWNQRAQETGSQADLRRAVAALERGRARALLDLMGDTHGAVFAGSLDEIADRLIAEVVQPGVAILSYTIGIDTLYAKVLLPSGQIEAFYVEGGSDSIRADAAALRRELDVDSAIVRAVNGSLEPVVGERGLGLQAGSASRIPLDTALARVARHTLPPALTARLEQEGISELVIITDAEIASIPFAALPFDAAGTPLGERMRLRFSPSLAMLVARAPALPSATTSPPLVVGNPYMPVVTTASGAEMRLNPLPGAQAEAAAVARHLGVRALGGADATERDVRDALSTASVVHLATHGYAYAAPSRVRDSFVALAPGGGEDGLLTVGEVLDEVDSMRADLVVLSACQTGLGKTSYTEGTIGMQRAFLAKGARSLLVSLWSVNDAVTQQLMERFYHHWTGGTSKAEALRRAQLDVRKDYPNPRYWAAFQLVGEG